MRLALLSLVAAVVLAGCGDSRTPAPDTGLIPAPNSFRELKFPPQGISVHVPDNWRVFPGSGVQVATIAIGDAQIAIWRYERTDPLPVTRAQLTATRQALIAQVKSRDTTFRLTSSRLVIKPRLLGVELIGTGTNHGERRSVRSLHAYGHGYEVVVDAFAPPTAFARVDAQAFAPVARSLRLSVPKKT